LVMGPYVKQFCEFCHKFKPCELLPSYKLYVYRKTGSKFICQKCRAKREAVVDTARAKALAAAGLMEPSDNEKEEEGK
jgi:hypothetical protein